MQPISSDPSEDSAVYNSEEADSSIGSIVYYPSRCFMSNTNGLQTQKASSTYQLSLSKVVPESGQSRELKLADQRCDKIYSGFHKLIVKMNISKFKENLLQEKKNQQNLNLNHYTVISDNSYDILQAPSAQVSKFDLYMQKTLGSQNIRILKRKLNKVKHIIIRSKIYIWLRTALQMILSTIPLFDGDNSFYRVWQAIVCLIQLYFIVTIPIEVAFNNRFLSVKTAEVTFSLLGILLVDFFVKINTAYIQYGKTHRNRMQILWLHIKDGMIYDIVTVLIVLQVLIYNHHFKSQDRSLKQFLPLVIFSQGVNVLKEQRKFEERMYWSVEFKRIYNIVNVLIALFLAEHIFACVWSYIGLIELEYNDEGWVKKFCNPVGPWQYIYIDAFYFTTVTLISVGYGDITPQSILIFLNEAPSEKMVSILFMFLSTVQLSYSLSKVASALEDLSVIQDQALNKMRAINHFMNKQGVSLNLRYKITEYLSMYWRDKFQYDQMNQEDIIKDLSDSLREQLMQETTLNLISKLTFIDQNFSRWFKLELSQIVKQVCICPDGMIELCESEDPENQYLYYIDEGTVEEVIPINSKFESIPNQKVLQRGMSFGLDSFVSGNSNQRQFRSRGFGRLFKIERRLFIQILKEFPVDFEKFCMIRDQLSFQSVKTFEISQPCDFCYKKDNHHIYNCRSLHFIPDREKIIKSHQFQQNQERNCKFKRFNRKKSKCSTLSQQSIQIGCNNYIQNTDNPYDNIYDFVGGVEKNVKTLAVRHGTVRRVSLMDPNLTILIAMQTNSTKLKEKQQIEYWKSRIDDLWSQFKDQIIERFPQTDSENLALLHLKLNNTADPNFQEEYDKLEEFTFYHPQNNISQVVRFFDSSKEIHTLAINKFIRYLFFPNNFVKRYMPQENRNNNGRGRGSYRDIYSKRTIMTRFDNRNISRAPFF